MAHGLLCGKRKQEAKKHDYDERRAGGIRIHRYIASPEPKRFVERSATIPRQRVILSGLKCE